MHPVMAQVVGTDDLHITTQDADSVLTSQVDSILHRKEDKFIPVPQKATRWALIPGGGQLYNRDYWKLPLIYLGIGGGVYAYVLNQVKYQDYLSAYKSFYDLNETIIDENGDVVDNPDYGQVTGDATRPVLVRNLFHTESKIQDLTIDQVKRGKTYWRRSKNLSIIVAGIIYGLTIVEANVAAHLKTFDLSEDLSLKIGPKLQQPRMLTPTPGIRLVFNLK
ncbi:hypothetical protein CLV98_11080 [Dyadobacter jejuensis]|uniref:DUF5683 domain-containing protein n=2 Tax=Dyadobacter jejuensis TaxID=1082580 RepID=A0A316AHM8_9BACT|nr:hypothetical protein CLV98_11080 [Dyadobacter jejuensis]